MKIQTTKNQKIRTFETQVGAYSILAHKSGSTTVNFHAEHSDDENVTVRAVGIPRVYPNAHQRGKSAFVAIVSQVGREKDHASDEVALYLTPDQAAALIPLLQSSIEKARE